MTNEQAIDRLRKISEKTPIRTNGDDLVAITMAIQAMLENEELSKDLDEALKEIDGYERGLSQEPCNDALIQLKKYTEGKQNTDKVEISVLTLNRIIKALSQEPTDKPMCDRNICISNEYNGIGCDECIVNKAEQEPCDDAFMQCMNGIKDIISVTPKSGKWITEEIGEGRKVYCSECKESADFEYVRDGDIYSSYGHGVVKKTKYCPNCGCRMRGVE